MDNNKGFSENRFLFILIAILFVILGPLFFMKFSNIKVSGFTLNMPDASVPAEVGGGSSTGGQPPSDPAAPSGGTLAAVQKDNLVVTAIKTLAVTLLVLAALVFSLLTGLADLFFLTAGHRFPLTSGVWGFVWKSVVIDWYWIHASLVGILLGVLITGGLVYLAIRLGGMLRDQEAGPK